MGRVGMWVVWGLVSTGAGCTPRDEVVKVGHRGVTFADIALAQQTSRQTAPQSLETIVSRELLAEAATQADLDKKPEIAARIKAATREVLAQAYLDQQLSGIDEAAVRARFEADKETLGVRQRHLAHIFVAMPAEGDEARKLAESRANTAWARLLGSDEFRAVARELSEDAGTAGRGGDLGQVREGQLAQDLFEVAAALKVNEVSRPTHSSFGIHIFKALSPLERVQPSFDEVKGQLTVKLRHEAQARLNEQLSREIRVVRHTEKLDAEGRK